MKPILKQLVVSKKLPQTLLFCGPSGSGKKKEAVELAVHLMGEGHRFKLEKGIHPDFLLFSPQGKLGLHPVETVRQLLSEAALSSFEALLRLFVIDEAQRMLPASSNALLKTLEEPLPHVYFLLLTTDPDSLLPTIASRCRRFDFTLSQKPPVLHPLLLEALLGKSSHRRLLEIFESLEREIDAGEEVHQKQKGAEELFHQILIWHRDLDLVKRGEAPGCISYPEHRTFMKEAPPSPSFKALLELVEKCLLALQRSLKLRTVLEYFFLNLSK